jgi:hypothetical protein
MQMTHNISRFTLFLVVFSFLIPAAVAAAETNVEPILEDVWPLPLNIPVAELDSNLDHVEPEEPVTWGRTLPFMAQKVIDLGYELPHPYGVGAIGVAIEQDLVLSELEVAVDGQPIDVNFVSFDDADARNKSLQFRADAWVLPFLNVYLVGGEVDGKANIFLSMPAEEVINLIAPELCEGFIRPPVCDETIHLNPQPHYNGNTIGVGTLLAGGWNQYFATLALTWVETDLNIVDSEIRTLNASPRVGMTLPLKSRDHVLSLFAGGNYLDAEMDLTGRIDIPVDGVGISTIEYKINQKNKDEWNYLFGLNYDLGRHWNFNAEIGFGGSRENIIAGAIYRW